MEKKSGIVVTREGLFIPARYFRRMTDRIEIVLAPDEINIRSSAKRQQSAQEPAINRKTGVERSRA